ncbi:MAG TPA: M10 family metallopeptidase C-terminal domain-containing protein [Allosphingosinicella sp.]|jgi:Ca2+-binding RTX toxin-like protein
MATFTGGGADDSFLGTGDRDIASGDEGNDILVGLGAKDKLDGGAGNDILNGGDEGDYLLSGPGDDQLSGEGGDDYLYFGAYFGAADLAAGGAGSDYLALKGNYVLTLSGSNMVSIESLILWSASTSFDEAAPGGSFSYSLTTADSLVSGTDRMQIDGRDLTAGEVLTFDGSAETSGGFSVFGGADSDSIITGAGKDILDGGGGADVLRGGLGDDQYVIDDIGDVIIENDGEGIDMVVTTLPVFSMFGTSIESLLAGDDLHHDYRGNSADNVMMGGDGNDFFRLQDGGRDWVYGGSGNDVFLWGAALTGSDIVHGDGGTDQMVLQGDYTGISALSFMSLYSIEIIAILPGDDLRFGDPGTNFYDYRIAVDNSDVSAGAQLVVDANRLRVGEDFTFDGSDELDGSFFIYGGGGVDLLTGGAKNDVFIFGGQSQFGSGDVVTGGAGIDQLALRGNYTITFGAGQLVGVEQIGMVSAQDTRYGALGSVYSYDLTMVDANVDSIQMTVDASPLRTGETLKFDGSAEDDGSFRVFGGRDNDSVVGSQNGDILAGNAGADSLTGGGGADVFRYLSASDSTASAMDRILDFAAGSDKIDLGRIDADSLTAGDQAFVWIGSSAFSGAAGELRAYQSGSDWIVEGDTDGNGAADLVIQLTVAGGPLTQGDFLP